MRAGSGLGSTGAAKNAHRRHQAAQGVTQAVVTPPGQQPMAATTQTRPTPQSASVPQVVALHMGRSGERKAPVA
jgi:hypothetical protein